MNKKQIEGHVSSLVSVILIALLYSAIQTVSPKYISPSGVVVWRMLMGVVVIWLASIFIKGEQVEKRDLYFLLFAGAFLMYPFQYLFVAGIAKTSAIDASIINTSTPVIIFLILFFLKQEKFTRGQGRRTPMRTRRCHVDHTDAAPALYGRTSGAHERRPASVRSLRHICGLSSFHQRCIQTIQASHHHEMDLPQRKHPHPGFRHRPHGSIQPASRASLCRDMGHLHLHLRVHDRHTLPADSSRHKDIISLHLRHIQLPCTSDCGRHLHSSRARQIDVGPTHRTYPHHFRRNTCQQEINNIPTFISTMPPLPGDKAILRFTKTLRIHQSGI